MNKKGMTILEILVVMAIIMILASIIVPTFLKARRNAARAKCINNLKNIGLITHIYAMDFDMKFPSAGGTGKKGLSILKKNYITDEYGFICPSSENSPPAVDYYFADELTENSPADSAIAIDDEGRHEVPKNFNVLYVDGHVASSQTSLTGPAGRYPVD